MAFGPLIRRNFVSVLFPTLAISTIWLDWSNTKKWKEANKAQLPEI